jgi:hypothetical protein
MYVRLSQQSFLFISGNPRKMYAFLIFTLSRPTESPANQAPHLITVILGEDYKIILLYSGPSVNDNNWFQENHR